MLSARLPIHKVSTHDKHDSGLLKIYDILAVCYHRFTLTEKLRVSTLSCDPELDMMPTGIRNRRHASRGSNWSQNGCRLQTLWPISRAVHSALVL